MDSLGSLWSSLDTSRRIAVIGATLAVFAAVAALGLRGAPRDLALLYGNLEPAAAGEVVSALEARGMPYEVRGTGIFVEAAQRDRLRVALAGEGLPAGGAQGYEILDSLSGFGTTSQMFDAAYWRAKEGELARTILASPHVRSARVHLSIPVAQGFARRTAPSGAVTVTTASGGLDPAQARALRHLVAAAVPDLAPADVAVIDGATGLVSDGAEEPRAGDASARENEMRARVERLLEARVGPGNAVVELAIATKTESEQITERRIDPEGRVAIATETGERTRSSSDSGGGVTVASNLPDGDAAEDGGQSASRESETQSRTNYEISETRREVRREPGAIRRISVAVLVNEAGPTDGSGATTGGARPPEELEALRDLVASAVGYDEARGDVITLRAMAFEAAAPRGTLATREPAAIFGPLDPAALARIAALAAVALVLGLFVLRPVLLSARRPALEAPSPPALASEAAQRRAEAAGAALSGPEPATIDMAAAPDDAPDGAPDGAQDGDPVTRLRRLMSERREESMRLLQSWIDDPRHEETR